MKYQTVHRDANHISIVKDLRKLGKVVIDLAAIGNSVPDLIVADPVVTALIEVKMPKSQVYIAQLEFLARWPNVAGLAETTEDAIAIMTDPKKRLTDREKDIILKLCIEYRAKTTDLRPRIRIMEFEKRFAEMKGEI